jgi:BlaI family transcriptional regulator, penicillinase repressor
MKTRPSELELEVLSLLWDRGPLTVREILETLPDRKARAYTSVLSVMQVMEKKGLVGRSREGVTDRWRAAVRRHKVMGPFLQKIVSRLFAGRPSAVLQQLLEANPVSREEMESLKRLIQEHEKQLPPTESDRS